MFSKASLKCLLTVSVFLLLVIPAVDGGTNKLDFEKMDKAPINKHVKQFVNSYINENRKNLSKIEKRSSSPFLIIDSVFKKYKLPVQLKYLAVVESELKSKAVSKVGAAGPWQLMPKTARMLGLKVSKHHDERKDYFKSTSAAANHLKYLHGQYNDWLLVFAAYNAGEAPVNAAIRKSGSRNFWTIRRFLPGETKEYVNKFIATCFYFEGTYNAALLSKSDNLPYLKSSANIKEKQPEIQPAKATAETTAPKKEETPEEKYNRILRASDEALDKSNKLLKTIK